MLGATEPAWIEVAPEDSILLLNLAKPHAHGDFPEVLDRYSLTLPDTWVLRPGNARQTPQVEVARSDWEVLPPWLDGYFKGPLDCPADYVVEGWFAS